LLKPVHGSCLIPTANEIDHRDQEGTMTRKRLALLGAIAAAALAAAGVAAAHRGAPSVQSVTATFNATTVTQHSLTTCSVNGGDTFQATRATYTGTATSADPRLAGTLTIRAWSLVDTTNGVGHLFGNFRIVGAGRDRAHGTLNAAIAGGNASGLARGFVRGKWGHVVASLGSAFSPTTGFSSGSIGSSTVGAGFLRSGRWCHPANWPAGQGA
jgi:hypothetical protein